ncbi:MAG: sensor histidine kinase [Vallitaleaceae bacterium]|nr:sensor histidine kinase [Vallitaleaceae bacterium]
MIKKNELMDQGVIFCACVVLFLVQTVYDDNVIPIIITIILWSLFWYLEVRWGRFVIGLAYFVISVFVPEMIVFIPLFAYRAFIQESPFYVVGFVALIFVHWNEILGMPLASLLACLGFSLLLKYRTTALRKLKDKYNQISDDGRELTAELKQKNKELYDKIDSDIHLATLKERNRIAREIHDNVGHQLSSAILQVGALMAVHRDENIHLPLTTVNETLTKAMTDIRESVHDLHDQSVDFHSQMETLLGCFSFCETLLDDQIIHQPDKRIKQAFLAITKEALSNVAKHSDATKVSFVLREHPAFYQFIIKDNGKTKTRKLEDGLGLLNMTDRIQALKGYINIQEKLGFEIFITVPKEERL